MILFATSMFVELFNKKDYILNKKILQHFFIYFAFLKNLL
jgi:hypothetical protein